jgi:hypothetical protein
MVTISVYIHKHSVAEMVTNKVPKNVALMLGEFLICAVNVYNYFHHNFLLLMTNTF